MSIPEEKVFIINGENKDLIDTMVLGAGFRASGGGGAINASRVLAKKIKDELDAGRTIRIVEPEDVPDDAWCATIASMGSPVALAAEGVSFSTFMNSWEQMDQLNRGANGAPLEFVMPVEVGSWSSLAPFAVSLMTDNIYVINGEGAGRAVPTLDLTRLSYASSSPTVIASQNDSYDDAIKIGLFVEDVDTVQSLADAILPTPDFNSIGGVALWALQGKEMKTLIVAKTYTDIAIPSGQVMRDAISQESPFKYLIDNTPGAKLVVRGTVTTKNLTTSKALDLLNVTVEGVNVRGESTTTVVYGMNENIFAFSNNVELPVVAGPDLLCWATYQQPQMQDDASWVAGLQPLDNSNIEEGMYVVLIAIPADEITANDDKMLSRWKSTMKTLGYAGEQKSGIFTNENQY